MQKTLTAILLPALLSTPAIAAPKPAKAKPPVLTCKTATPEGLSYTVLKAGKGDKPAANSKVKVNYKGLYKSDGTEFDAGSGTEFGVGGVITGFGQGLQMMQPGAKYRLCIPSKLGYGEAGYGSVPGNADLVFEVELLSFTTPPPKPVVPLAERTCTATTASGLGYVMLKPGTGRTPTAADMALVDFTVFNAQTGTVMEKREWEKIPMARATQVFIEALSMMQGGSNYTFCLPKDDAAEASEPRLNIRVDLLDVRVAPLVE